MSSQREDELEKENHELRCALAAERNVLETLINTIPHRIFVKDRECRFTLNNIAHVKALGASGQDEVIGKTDHDFRPAYLADGYFADDMHVMENDSALLDYEEPARLPSGELGTLLISKAPLHNETGDVIGIVGISCDITDRKNAENKLRRNAKIQAVLREISDAATSLSLDELFLKVHQSIKQVLPANNFYISLVDEVTGEVLRPYCVDEMKIIPRRRTNAKGLTDYVMRRRRVICLTPPELAQLRESGEIQSKKVDFSSWAGAPLIDSAGKVFGIIALFSVAKMEQPFQPGDAEILSIIAAQVSMAIERNRTEEAMRASEERFANAFNYAAIGMAMFSPSGRCIKVNRSLCHLLGYEPEELLAMNIEDLTYVDDLHVTAEHRCRLLSGEINSYHLEKRYYNKSGQIVWAMVSASLVRSESGEPLQLVAQIEDITNRKHMEQELRVHAGKLEETVERRTQELFAANQELTALNQQMAAMNEVLVDTNRSLANEIDVRQQKEDEALLREKQYRATTSLLMRSGEDIDGLLEAILQDAVKLVGASGGDICLLDDSGRNFIFHHSVGINQALSCTSQPVDQGMLGHVFRCGEFLYVEDYRLFPHRITGHLADRLTTVLMVPLQQDGKLTGALTATWQDETHPVTPENMESFRQFGILASIAIERAHAGERISYQKQLLQQLAESTASLIHELDLEKALENILAKATTFMGIPHGFIQLFEPDGSCANIKCGKGWYEILAGKPMYFDGKGIFEAILHTGKLVIVDDYANWPQRMTAAFANDITAAMQAPLNVDGKTIGSIGLTAFGGPFVIDQEKLAVFEQFATIAAVAIKNALSHQETNRLAFFDTLTGLPNRTHLNLRLEAEMNQARGGESAGAVMFIDLDDLKTVNDHFGHTYGDGVIAAAGRDIVGAVGDGAYIARAGGDEFVVILPGADLEHIAQTADRLVGAIRKEYEVRGQSIHMSTSIGITLYPVDAVTAEGLLKNADIAMYAAKASGKNNWRFYEPEMLEETYDQMVLTNSLRHALEKGELYLNYQPQISLSGRKVTGFEALLRWNSKKHGMIPPVRFIPLAEKRGLIQSIGQWVVGEACRFAGKLAELGFAGLHVAVNVSPKQLASGDFVDMVRRSLDAAGIAPQQLEIEITENVLIESLADSTHKLVELSALGVRLSLDDFGTGYSSLTYLRNLPVETLKIDKSFIDRIMDGEVEEGFIRSIVDMAHVLGLNVIAEGVETEPQLSKLTQFGCDCVQGFVFSEPVSQEEALQFKDTFERGDAMK